MELFQDITELQEYVGGAVSNSMEEAELFPYLDQVLEQYVFTRIDKRYYDYIIDEVDPSFVNFNKNIKRHLWTIAGAYLLWQYSFIGEINMTSRGLLREESDDYKTAYKYQINAYRENMRNLAHNSIEQFCKTIFRTPEASSSVDYKTYRTFIGLNTLPEEHRRNIFVWNATIFQQNYGRYISRFTYDNLIATIINVEDIVINDMLTGTYAYNLRTSQDVFNANFQTTVTAEGKLINLIRKAVTYITIMQASYNNLIEIRGDRVLTKDKVEQQSHIEEITPSSAEISAFSFHNDTTARTYLKRIQAHIDDNYDNFNILQPPPSVKTPEKSDTEENNSDTTNNPVVRL